MNKKERLPPPPALNDRVRTARQGHYMPLSLPKWPDHQPNINQVRRTNPADRNQSKTKHEKHEHERS